MSDILSDSLSDTLFDVPQRDDWPRLADQLLPRFYKASLELLLAGWLGRWTGD